MKSILEKSQFYLNRQWFFDKSEMKTAWMELSLEEREKYSISTLDIEWVYYLKM